MATSFMFFLFAAHASVSLGHSCLSLVQHRAQRVQVAREWKEESQKGLVFDHHTLELNFEDSTLAINNLDGQGPGTGRPVMLLEGVASLGGRRLDLEVSALSAYSANMTRNGINGKFLQINADGGSSVDLIFSFVDASGQPVYVPRTTLSFLDLDTGNRGNGTEKVMVSPIISHFLNDPTEVITTKLASEKYSFEATVRGRVSDNPTDPKTMTPLQLSRSVEVDVAMVSEIFITLDVSANKHGRNFLFGSVTRLREVGEETNVGECEDYTPLHFTDHVGGSVDAASGGMLFDNVATIPSGPVKAKLIADSAYKAANASRNGETGGLVNVNVKGNVSTELTLSFMDSTGAPVYLDKYFITLLDLDGPKYGTEQVAIARNMYTKYYVTPSNHLTVDHKAGETTFTSQKFGRLPDNPKSKEDIQEYQKDVGVTFLMRQQSEVKFTYTSNNAMVGRNFLITGATEIACD